MRKLVISKRIVLVIGVMVALLAGMPIRSSQGGVGADSQDTTFAASSSGTTIDFEGLLDDQPIGTIAGATFSSNWLALNSCSAGGGGNFINPPSGVGIAFVLVGGPGTAGTITFAQPVSKVITRYVSRVGPLTLTAFDASHNVLDTEIGPQTPFKDIGQCGLSDTWGTLSVSSSTNRIVSVTIHDTGNFFAIDDFTFETCSPPTSLKASINDKNCDQKKDCAPNILFADGKEFTTVDIKVQPAQSVFVHFSASFGSVEDAQTDTHGMAFVRYTSGTINAGVKATTVATLNALACNTMFSNLEHVFNYSGYNFHQLSVTDPAFTDSTTMDANAIREFFLSAGEGKQRSFLANFYFVGQSFGFLDKNNNMKFDKGEPTYSAKGAPFPFPPGQRGLSAANVFSGVAQLYGINPKILLATLEKENSLISQRSLPIIKGGVNVTASVLNLAMGCGGSSTFFAQIDCAAKTLRNRFNDTSAFGRSITYPFFFTATDGFRHAATGTCCPPSSGCVRVAFQVQNAATYAQYRYTPFIQALLNGGGVYLFEKIWNRFGF